MVLIFEDSHDTVQTIRYAVGDNPALQHEKAYILNYDTPPGVPKSNFVIDYYPGIKIRNLRTAGLSFQTNGIMMTELDGCMPRADFDDEHKVEDFYLPQVHAALRKALGADEVYIFDYMIRKRAAAFPFQPKGKDRAPQPALSAHIDYTTNEIKGRVEKYFKSRSEEFKSRHFQIVK
ncbi:hypothetical protein C7974DRAFT_87777 [Boeremia exigua]|uniref:uncharacterized protein n=1 Tax=Boeremia exigua TaxID=749465 RepID=UPI001E8DB85C|nr:uncharacterized protein C7974DRAFT_87777 [Boeremia exigua]KAH6611940.1 hypothetical protein C7974DRAFT_87777 [Boeremia exigua]